MSHISSDGDSAGIVFIVIQGGMDNSLVPHRD